MKNYQGKIKSVTINSPDDLNEVYENYAYIISRIYSEIVPNNFHEALKIANTGKNNG